MEKTNVMRFLAQKKIDFAVHEYNPNQTDAVEVAKLLNRPPEQVFKTLVTTAGEGRHYVFVIPACKSLDLKKAAKVVGVKSISMLKQKELFPLTGYIHGGCSPIGMKKQFHTVLEESVKNWDRICVSAGKVGMQVELSPNDLQKLTDADIAQLTEDRSE